MINPGVLLVRNEPPKPESTIVVTGVGRSGTSMVAMLLSQLGLYMGETEGEAVVEDKEMQNALMFFYPGTRDKLIAQRNTSHAKWGFKFPTLQNHLHPPELLKFRNPRLIVVFRDVVSVSQRSFMSGPNTEEELSFMAEILHQQSDLIRYVKYAPCPALMLSYEKCLLHPGAIAKLLASFCGLQPTEQQTGEAVRSVEADNPSYIKLFHAA